MTRTRANGDHVDRMETYLREIGREPLLDELESAELPVSVAEGDDEARSRMIRGNLRLVVKIAREFTGRGLDFEDLVGEGNLGLIDAVERFDPSFGVRFSTYARYWILQGILGALANTGNTIRIPVHMVTLLTKFSRAERALRRELGHAPSSDEVAAALGLTDRQRVALELARRARELRAEGGDPDDETAWTPDALLDDGPGPEAALDSADDRRELIGRLGRLDARERAIVALRLGLDGEPPMTLERVSRRVGVTREWIRKLELRAVAKLLDEPPTPAPRGRRPRAARAV